MRHPDFQVSTFQKVQFLSQAANYSEKPTQIEVIETHMSWVFLADQSVYKLKKPVKYEFLDFSTLTARYQNCLEEVRLNRQLAPNIYLGLVPLTVDAQGKLHLGTDGIPVDWLVKMRRLPAAGMLDDAIARGTVRLSDLRPVAELLARFYQTAPAVPLSAAAYRQTLEADLQASRQVLVSSEYGLPPEWIDRITDSQMMVLNAEPELFDRRVAENRIVEGHGDLRPQHICLKPEAAIIDRLEFNRTLRILDPADELAFLALECERLGAAWMGDFFLEVYGATTGDRPPQRLIEFYKSYRACLRAKLSLWHIREPGQPGPERWLNQARTYLHLADGLLQSRT
jgi:aminoglycoside phosphotransferase family enzyme